MYVKAQGRAFAFARWAHSQLWSFLFEIRCLFSEYVAVLDLTTPPLTRMLLLPRCSLRVRPLITPTVFCSLLSAEYFYFEVCFFLRFPMCFV